MYDKLLNLMIRFRHDDEGVTLVEYGVAVALAVAVGTLALTALGTDITQAMGAAGARMPTTTASATATPYSTRVTPSSS